MDEPHQQHTKKKKPDIKEHILYNLYRKSRIGKPIETGSTLVFAWSWAWDRGLNGMRDVFRAMELFNTGLWQWLHNFVILLKPMKWIL